jgi:hypothetical protein
MQRNTDGWWAPLPWNQCGREFRVQLLVELGHRCRLNHEERWEEVLFLLAKDVLETINVCYLFLLFFLAA